MICERTQPAYGRTAEPENNPISARASSGDERIGSSAGFKRRIADPLPCLHSALAALIGAYGCGARPQKPCHAYVVEIAA